MEAVAHKTAYAKKEGKLVHISEVPRGLECGCHCVACGQALIARKGLERCHHFAHAVADTNCNGGAETALHLMAKEILSEVTNIVLPVYIFSKEKQLKSGLKVIHQEQIADGGSAVVSGARIEPMLNGFRPDVILNCRSKNSTKELIIEIAVTHFVDRHKKRCIRDENLPAVEVRLNFGDALLPREELRNKLVNDISSKSWLFHPKQREAERTYISKLREAIRKRPISGKEVQSRRRVGNEYAYFRSPNSLSPYEQRKFDEKCYMFHRQHGRAPTDDEYQEILNQILRYR